MSCHRKSICWTTYSLDLSQSNADELHTVHWYVLHTASLWQVFSVSTKSKVFLVSLPKERAEGTRQHNRSCPAAALATNPVFLRTTFRSSSI